MEVTATNRSTSRIVSENTRSGTSLERDGRAPPVAGAAEGDPVCVGPVVVEHGRQPGVWHVPPCVALVAAVVAAGLGTELEAPPSLTRRA
jgi:hypothetical protein